MRTTIVSAFIVGSLAACSVPPPATMSATYNPAEVAWAAREGNNTISGSAVLRTVGGDVKTCAGLKVTLMPVSAYATEYMEKTFGSSDSGISRYTPNVTLDPAFTGSDLTRNSICDAEGRFEFTNLPDGEFYVISNVTWGAVQGGRYAYVATQGGDLMQRVSVSGGQRKNIVLTS